MAKSGVESFTDVLVAAGRQALLRSLSELCSAIGAAESSILRPMSDEELSFFVSTNPELIGPAVPKVPIGGSFAGIVFCTGQMVAVADAGRQAGHFEGIDTAVGRATREYAALPIANEMGLIGVLTVVNRVTAGEEGTRPFTVDELRTAQQTASALAGPLAILDNLGGSLSPARRDNVREAFGDDFIRDLLALDETGRRVVRCIVGALPADLRAEES